MLLLFSTIAEGLSLQAIDCSQYGHFMLDSKSEIFKGPCDGAIHRSCKSVLERI